MPNFLSSLTDNSSSNEENDIKYENNNNNNNNNQQTEPVINCPTDTLTDMSLLGLPMNNADSLFGTSTNQNNNQINQEQKPEKNIVSNAMQNSSSDSLASNLIFGAFSSVNSSKKPQVKDNMSQLAQGNSTNPTSGYNLVHKKSDVCEWTESVSLALHVICCNMDICLIYSFKSRWPMFRWQVFWLILQRLQWNNQIIWHCRLTMRTQIILSIYL